MPRISVSGSVFECDLIVFDMTGTLVDSKARQRARAKSRAQAITGLVGEEATSHWAQLSGVSLTTWDVDESGPLARAPRREDLIVGATALYLAGLRWEEAKQIAAKAYDEADNSLVYEYKPSLFDGVEETITRLKSGGVKLAIATNDRRADAEETMASIGVLDLFDAVVGADDVDDPKPSPEMLLLACERCITMPSRAVCVGDLPSDMVAGRSAGMKAVVAVRSSLDPSSELVEQADFVIESVSQIEFHQ
ncbi:MAG: HAD family hydrolase [Candidatus Bathyarchaeota archaeon]|nr:MAG: HAD family hydrolase [Candidatus Bathyarchaeota archaeon]